MKAALLFLLIGLSTLSACSRQRTSPSPALGDEPYTEDDVRKFVLPGTSREAIIKRFGEPINDWKNPTFEDGSTDIDEILFFDLPGPNPPVEESWVFSGFQVRLKNGKAVQWMSSHRDTHVGR